MNAPTASPTPALPGAGPPDGRGTRRGRWACAWALLLLSPVCAEYLIGYDVSVGRPLQLLAGLLILGPLYGAVAVLIREVTRRCGRGWPTIVLLGAAFGLVQAGLIDQSLFHLEFDPDDPDWATESPRTPVPGLGIDAKNLLNWVGGHVVWSFAAPIAVVESCAPRTADRPWLGKAGLSVMVLLYLAAAAVIYSDVDGPGATPSEMTGTAAVVLVLIAAAFAFPRRGSGRPGTPVRLLASVPVPVPAPWLVGAGALAVFATDQMLPMSWTAVAVDVLVLSLLAGYLLLASGDASWRRAHVLAVAGAALLVRAGLSFFVEPLGDPSYAVKYAVNTALTLGVLGLLAWAGRRVRRDEALPGAS
ncbi:hypothetical protein ACFPA8_04540 [Streptomyces ovatisporus]|uniref:Integral membrane protein n=1 Tax=Streptomyces ovatisporus TaxID=1128682 RepID=A0ABV9A0B5_9ACTN